MGENWNNVFKTLFGTAIFSLVLYGLMKMKFFTYHMPELNKLYEFSHLKFSFISTSVIMLAIYIIVIIDNASNIGNNK